MDKLLLIGVLAAGVGAVSGSPVYDTPATLTGTRSVGSGLTNGGGAGYAEPGMTI